MGTGGRVQQPLLTSLFLRNTWLLPEVLESRATILWRRFWENRGRTGRQKRGDAAGWQRDGRPGRRSRGLALKMTEEQSPQPLRALLLLLKKGHGDHD